MVAASVNRDLGLWRVQPPATFTGSSDYSVVGTAFDYRARFYFAATRVENLIANHGSLSAVVATADHPDRYQDEWSFDTPTKRLVTVLDENNAEPFHAVVRTRDELIHQIDDCVEKVGPAGRHLPQESEDALNLSCSILAMFENCIRATPNADWPIVTALRSGSADAVRALVKPDWLSDLRALSWLFYESQGELLSRPATLNPTFAGSSDVGGGDADLIVDGLLIELTTQKQMLAAWKVQQLLSYLLLDYDDKYHIAGVGMYLARWGRLVQWPVKEFLLACSAGWEPDLSELRAAFREAMHREKL